MTPALHQFDTLRETFYREGIHVPHLDDLRAIAAWLHQIGADRRDWIAAADAEMRELEDLLHDAVMAALVEGVEAVVRTG